MSATDSLYRGKWFRLLLLLTFLTGCQSETAAPPDTPESSESKAAESGGAPALPLPEAQEPEPVAAEMAANTAESMLRPERGMLPTTEDGYPEPFAALPFFARSVPGGWHFPSRYHYHEWRHAAGLRRLPDTVADPTGQDLRLSSGDGRKRLVILLDDLGNSGWALRRIAELPFVVNGAILPHTPLAARAATTIRETGGDVLLHLPLEPVSYPRHDPGRGALFVTMPTDQRVSTLLTGWDSIPQRIGLNNHMGSRYTVDAEGMADIAGTLADQSPIFVDSRTVPRSQAHVQMIRHGIPSLGRTHFLDQEATPEAVRNRLEQAVSAAVSQGAALAIGHPNRATLDVLAEATALFADEGVEVVSLQDLFHIEP